VPVSLRTATQDVFVKLYGGKCWGDSLVFDDSATVRLARGIGEDVALDTLLHEYGHLLDKGPKNARNHHRNSWGVGYAKAYRAWMDYLEGK